MDVKVIKSSKDEAEIELGSITIAEILRVYLNKDSAVRFAGWRRSHPKEKPILVVKCSGKTAKKVVNDAVSVLTKDLDKTLNEFKKLK